MAINHYMRMHSPECACRNMHRTCNRGSDHSVGLRSVDRIRVRHSKGGRIGTQRHHRPQASRAYGQRPSQVAALRQLPATHTRRTGREGGESRRANTTVSTINRAPVHTSFQSSHFCSVFTLSSFIRRATTWPHAWTQNPNMWTPFWEKRSWGVLHISTTIAVTTKISGFAHGAPPRERSNPLSFWW